MGQGVVQSETNWYPRLPVLYKLLCKKNGPPNFPRKKVRFSIGNIDLSACSIFKNIEISLGQGVVQSEPNWYPRLPVLFKLLCKKNGPPNFPRKKVRFSIGNIDLFAYSIFKNIEILLGQRVVQSGPNWFPRLPVLFKLLCKKNGPPNFPRKKVRFSIGNIDLFAYSIFKNIEILSGQWVVQSGPNWFPRLPVLFKLLCKKNGPPNFPRKKVRFSIGNIDLFAYSIFKNIEILSGQWVVQSGPNWFPRLPVIFRL